MAVLVKCNRFSMHLYIAEGEALLIVKSLSVNVS